jgi:hypothetical protein
MNGVDGFKIVVGIGLALFALFFGGCSALFAYDEFFGNGFGAYILWVPGLVLGALSAYGAFKMLFVPKPSEDAAHDTNDTDRPSSPPDP